MLDLILAASLTAATPAAGQDCQAILGALYEGPDEAELADPVDGRALDSVAALVALRAARGDVPIVVMGGNFAQADFRGARLHNICFLNADLAGSDWRGVEAAGMGFVRSDLSGARMTGARLPRILLRQPVMKDVDASEADLSEGRLDGGWDGSLENLRLDRASLRGFRFDCGITIGDGCPLERRISFRGADLTGASLNTYRGGGDDDWTGARIDRTEVGLHQVEEMASADMIGPLLVRGGDAVVELSAADRQVLIARIRPSEEARTPSFDCSRAAAAVERLICGSEGGRLRALDVLVAGLYRRVSGSSAAPAAAQRAWLRERNRCAADESAGWSCVQEAYERRREQLIGRIGPPDWARAGATVLFVVPVVDFDDGFRDDPLYRRLLPVIEGGAWSHVAVRVNADGSLDARGEAVGANAHTCSLAAERLQLDRSTGWYSTEREPESGDPPAWRGRPIPILLFWGERGEVYRHGHPEGGGEGVDPRAGDYASCGVRAGFGELVRLPVPEAESRAFFESLDEAP